MLVASNIFNSPENTGPGSFGRRLALALRDVNIHLLPAHFCANPDIYFANAFFDMPTLGCKTILRLDGAGAGQDKAKVERAHRMADMVIYQSEYSCKLLQDAHSYKPTNFAIIHNGVDNPIKTVEKPNGQEFLSICNTWNEFRYSNFMSVVCANLDKIVKVFPDFKWNIVGKYHPFENALISAGYSEYLYKHIRFIQFTPNLHELRAACTAQIHLVPTDSCPNSVVESLACGLPCIVWYDSAGPELIEKDLAGKTLFTNSADELISAMQDILDDWHFFNDEALRLFKTKYNIRNVASEYAKIFNAMLA